MIKLIIDIKDNGAHTSIHAHSEEQGDVSEMEQIFALTLTRKIREGCDLLEQVQDDEEATGLMEFLFDLD